MTGMSVGVRPHSFTPPGKFHRPPQNRGSAPIVVAVYERRDSLSKSKPLLSNAIKVLMTRTCDEDCVLFRNWTDKCSSVYRQNVICAGAAPRSIFQQAEAPEFSAALRRRRSLSGRR